MSALSLPLYLLAGGRCRRFGRDKARAPLGELPLVVHVARRLAPVSGAVTVVAAAPGAYADLGLRTIADRQPGSGPAGGLEAALADRRGRHGRGWILLVPCDVAHLEPRWVRRLAAAADPAAPPAVAFRGARWEPLPALYHTDLLDHPVLAAPAGLALGRVLDRVGARALAPPADWHRAVRVDTPSALARAARTP